MTGYNRKQTGRCDGFTLLEMVVVIGIFSIVLLMITGMYTRFTGAQRRSVAEQSVQSDLRFAMELFNREARTGFGSTYDIPDGTNGKMVVLRNQNSLCVAYRFSNNALERAEKIVDMNTDCRSQAVDYNNFLKITKNETLIDVDKSDFFVKRADVNNEEESYYLVDQGFITVNITAKTADESVPPFYTRSTVTSRQVIPFELLTR